MKSSLPSLAALTACAAALARAEVYFREDFSAGKLDTERWVASEARPDYGAFEVAPGAWFADEKKSRGLRTTQDYRFYSISAPLDKAFDTTGKDLVVQFSVKNEQIIECGGGYLKLLPPDFSPKNFTGDSPYELMFGPDICGPTHRLHVIFRYKDENKLTKKDITCPDDHFTHLYTLIVKPDQTYKILVDQKEELSGSLLEHWDFLPPKTIKDPEAKKPEDWVDEEMIDDPQDTKPEGYDDIPEFIPTEKPADWDDEADGEWIPANKENPEYKGKWTPKKIKNPNYKGAWVHPEIPNPDYVADDKIYVRNIGFVGFDLWQVKSGTIFDDLLISDSIEEAAEAAKGFEEFHKKEEEAIKKVDEKFAAEADDAEEVEESVQKAEEHRKQEELKEKAEKVVAAEELAAIEENEPIEDALGGSLVDTAAKAAADSGETTPDVSETNDGSGAEKIKQAIKDEL